MNLQSRTHQFASSSEGLEAHLDVTNRSIRISPDEVTFTQVLPNVTYTEKLTLTNTLTAPVELVSFLYYVIWRNFSLSELQTANDSKCILNLSS